MTEVESVYSAVRAESLYKTDTLRLGARKFSITLSACGQHEVQYIE
jgi:hypothetical protein